MPTGQDFIRHEFDEAIAVQESIVRGATALAQVHPMPEGKRLLKTAAKDSERWLKRLQQRGKQFGATGEREEVAQGIDQLARTTMENAQGGEPSEVYEAHAMVINAIRKQQDSAGSIIRIARSMRDSEMATEAREMQRASRTTADDLAKNLTQLAVVIATDGQAGTSARRASASRTPTRASSRKALRPTSRKSTRTSGRTSSRRS